MRDPLIIYSPDMDLTLGGYVSNGLRILYPTTAEHTLEFGQAGSIHVVCPIDADGDWQAIQMHNVVRAPVMFRGQDHSQLFRIYRIKKTRSGGVPSIEFDARHIFYDLNYVVLRDVRPTSLNCEDAIQWLFDHPYAPDGTSLLPLQRYEFSSDIETEATSYFEWKTLSGALIGEDNCILNRWGGELYVDDYYFSINQRMENALDDAFTIAYGLNLTDITETIDSTNTYSRLVANDNSGNVLTDSVPISSIGLPFERTLHASFSYSEEGDNSAQFAADFDQYASKIMEVEASYSVKYADLSDGDPFWALAECEVGDTGTIRDDELGIQTTQKVIKTVTDLITGERISTDTGNLLPSISRRQPWSNTVSTTQTAAEKQIEKLSEEAVDAQAIFLLNWGTARNLTWQQASKFTWGKAAEMGGVS